jgi:hypothetical protein
LGWIPVGLAAVDSIITLLGPLVPPGAIAIITLVKAAFADLSAAITQYNNDTNPADKDSLLAKIKTILKDIADNFQSFLNALNLARNPIVNIVLGLANIFIAAIMGFLGQLPVTKTPTAKDTSLVKSVKVGGQSIQVVPKFYKNVAEFKSDWNQTAMSKGHPEAEIK